MIPERLRLAGFLSYRDEQAIDFTSASLWLLAGSNGSGKSSVFDALTYALFGVHRGGAVQAVELINKESTQARVEFEFHLQGESYRIKRTLVRKANNSATATQQLARRVQDDWVPIEGTSQREGFTHWVREHVGLNYETFTSSVLLLQGRAEKLLSAQPRDRADVLAQIVDLERYQKLHARANAKKLALKNRLEAKQLTQSAVPEVTDLEFAEAMLAVEAREDDEVVARKAAADAEQAERTAERYAEAVARHRAAADRLTRAEVLVGDAARIDELAARLAELQAVVPVVQRVLTLRTDRQTSDEQSAHFARQRDEAATEKKAAEHRLEQLESKRAKTRDQLAAAEADRAGAQARLPHVTRLREKARQLNDQSSRLAELERQLAENPDPADDLDRAQAEVEAAGELARVLPQLELISTERHELQESLREVATLDPDIKSLIAGGKTARESADALERDVTAATETLATARDRASQAEALVSAARAALKELAGSGNGASCSACGSPLTPEHRRAERERRDARLKSAEATAKKARSVATSAQADLDAAQATHRAAQNQVVELREEYLKKHAALKTAHARAKSLEGALDLRHAQLTPVHQAKLALPKSRNWVETTYPERDELARLRRQATALDALRARQRQLADRLRTRQHLLSQADAVRQLRAATLAELGPVVVSELEEEYVKLQAALETSEESVRAARAVAEKLEQESNQARGRVHQAEQTMVSLRGRLDQELQKREANLARERDLLERLDDAWRARLQTAGMADRLRWQEELDRLTRDGVPDRARELADARSRLDALRQDVERHLAECEAFPESARVELADARALLVEARHRREQATSDLVQARHRFQTLTEHRERRKALGDELVRLAGEFGRHEQLAKLLDRDRLQRYLVRQAERQIVEYANGVLDRLSGGQLAVSLSGSEESPEAERALDLECYNRVTGSAPIGVAFLSGSQKFRVAVSLALAIGQYASRQHRPIESVIIDEGFGCLDRQGRQVMIQEFQNLRGHLRCILLVSHQEEFVEAFADGYRFELAGGTTRVERFSR